MFFYIAKIIAVLILPSSAFLLAIILGLTLIAFTRRQRLGMTLAIAGTALLVIGGFSPLANWLIYPLEQRFAATTLPGDNQAVTGIIILGGFENGWVSKGRPGLALNESAERLTEGVRLAKTWPDAKVVFTGGVATMFNRGAADAAGAVGAYMADMGIAQSRLVLEGNARDTYENAVFTRRLVAPKHGDTWLLVTSAYHMPRAIGVFRKAGFDVKAAPVDFRTRDKRDLGRFFSRASRGLLRIDFVTKEWLGLFAYWVTGRSSALFPGPNTS